MKNTIFKLTEYVYYFSLLVLLILYLFPGSLIGYFLYGNLGQQPDLITNPIGTSINHLIFFGLKHEKKPQEPHCLHLYQLRTTFLQD